MYHDLKVDMFRIVLKGIVTVNQRACSRLCAVQQAKFDHVDNLKSLEMHASYLIQ